jgi:hypothetical protein
MAETNDLLPYYQKLRCDFPIDYDELILTAKNLKTLSDEDKRTIISSLRKVDDSSFSGSDSSSENKNLMDQMMEKISQIDYPLGGQDRAVLKKRWWTPE